MTGSHVICSTDIKVVTIDVFDTIVTRNVYLPVDLFSRIKTRIGVKGGETFSRYLPRFEGVRCAAESTARKRLKDREEVTLDEIVALIIQEFSLSEGSSSIISSCEIEEELKSVVPVESTIDFIRKMRLSGKKIIFVSDMYLPENTIREMLIRAGVHEPQDMLYVSGDIGKKKSTGSLFRHIMDDLGLRPDQMIHVGDYLVSDYLIPRLKYGIRSIPVRIARNNIYERLWGEACRCLYCSSVAGASRAARASRSIVGVTSVETSLYNVGCNVLGPILVSFIHWVLQQAAQAGISRLYFLSRDGDIMLELARELAGRLGMEIDLRYLYVSRTAVFPALMGTDVNASTIEWLKEDNVVLTLCVIADRLKVDATRLCEQLNRADIFLSGPDIMLEKETVEQVCYLLMTDPSLREMVSESGRNALQNLAEYLEQEGLFDGTSFALVDLGWHGSIQDAIYTCFKKRIGGNSIYGYYFGVDRGGEAENRKKGFFFNSSETSNITRYQHLFRVIMEVMCSARHGMVHYYARNLQGKCEPICHEIEHPLNNERVEHIRLGISSFLKYLDLSYVETIGFLHVRPQMLSILKKLFFYPSSDEAVALGDFRFSADQAGHGVHRVAPPFTFNTAVQYAIKGSYAGRSSISSWFFASWVRSGCAVRLLLYLPVVLLRGYYVRSEILKFSKMKALDAFNKYIGVNIGLDK